MELNAEQSESDLINAAAALIEDAADLLLIYARTLGDTGERFTLNEVLTNLGMSPLDLLNGCECEFGCSKCGNE